MTFGWLRLNAIVNAIVALVCHTGGWLGEQKWQHTSKQWHTYNTKPPAHHVCLFVLVCS